MLDARMELERLRLNLKMKDVEEEVIEEVIDLAEGEISEVVSDILQMGLQEAIQAGEELDSEDFVAELRAINISSEFRIITDSGRTDFSEPPYPMLPSLLKNAKTAKDGSQYKVIPIENKAEADTVKKDTNKTSVAAMRALDQSMLQSAQGKQARKHGIRTGTRGMMEDAKKLAGYYNSLKPSVPEKRREDKGKGVAVDFRVASSKQDMNKKWVNPGKNKDFTTTLNRINSDMQSKISVAVADIIEKYQEMY